MLRQGRLKSNEQIRNTGQRHGSGNSLGQHCGRLAHALVAPDHRATWRESINRVSRLLSAPFCALANARSIPVAEAITQLYQDLDELNDIGEIDLHISGCINSCGHHHSGHIGILGVDKDGKEWYQITLGGSDGSTTSGAAQPGKVIGPSFSAHEVSEVVDAVLMTYLSIRQSIGSRQERFIETVRRAGLDPFKAAANDVRKSEERVA